MKSQSAGPLKVGRRKLFTAGAGLSGFIFGLHPALAATWNKLGGSAFVPAGVRLLGGKFPYNRVMAGQGGNQIVLRADGVPLVTGSNQGGCFGLGDSVNRSSFTPIVAVSNIISVGNGENFFALLNSDGALFTCGNNA
jgi:hypothetical protein